MKRKILAITAVSAALVALAGCASDGGSSDQGDVQITYAHWGNQAEADTIASIIAAFEEAHPEIKVEDQWLQGDYEQQVRVAIAGGTGPTVFQLSDQSIRSFASTLQDVDVDPATYYADNISTTMKVGDAYKAVPFVAKPKVMAVNGAIFDDAGVARPSGDEPLSLDEFIRIAPQLTSGEGNEKTFGSARLWFEGFLSVNDTGLFNQDGTKCTIDDPATIETADIVIAAEQDGWAPTSADAEGQDMFDWLSIGRLAMQPDFGPWDIAKLAALQDADIELVPVPGGGEPLEINGLGIGTYADEQQTAAANTFLNFVSTNPAAQELLTNEESSLGVPVVDSALDAFRAVAPDLNLDAFVTAVSQRQSPAAVPNKGQILEDFWNGVNERTALGAGNEAPAVVFPELQPGCQEKLDELLAKEGSN